LCRNAVLRDPCDNVVQHGDAVMTTLTIRLDSKLDKALARIAKSTGRTKSEIAREALERQVAGGRFRELRRTTLPFAEAQGFVSDEDVFGAVS
jgi:predicted transcriptional regulator